MSSTHKVKANDVDLIPSIWVWNQQKIERHLDACPNQHVIFGGISLIVDSDILCQTLS
jgi:hypothetical protein